MKETNVLATAKRLCGIVLAVVIALALAACSSDGGTTIIEGGFELDPDAFTVYTITFNSAGGSTVEPILAVVYGSNGKKYTSFPTPVRADLEPGLYVGITPGYSFDGWKKPDGEKWNYDTDKITSDITLTAEWTFQSASPVDFSGLTLGGDNIIEKSINYIKQQSTATNHTLVLDTNLSVATITYDAGVTLTITSNDNTERKIAKNTANGSVFIVTGNGTRLIIDGYVTLQGKTGNNAAVVRVISNGKLDLKGYAKITGNTTTSEGSGIYCEGGIITMGENAMITGNILNGVYTGTIAGGGVRIQSGSFTMNGGEISGNAANNVYPSGSYRAWGGGVYINNNSNAVFAVANENVKANIKNNTVSSTGGSSYTAGPQVYKDTNGIFTVGGVPATTF